MGIDHCEKTEPIISYKLIPGWEAYFIGANQDWKTGNRYQNEFTIREEMIFGGNFYQYFAGEVFIGK